MTAPRIVAIIGSTRFMTEIGALAEREALAGNIVLRPHVVKSRVMHRRLTDEQAEVAERVRGAEVRIAHRVLVANVDGYVGHSTLRLIDLARCLGTPIEYEYPPAVDGKRCLLCNGSGERVRIVNDGDPSQRFETCPRCGGSKLEPDA